MYTLPDLSFSYDAFEPFIDALTMEIHHTKHHAWYTKKLNAAIEWTDQENKTIEEILRNPDDLPEKTKQSILNNWWWYYNHLLFWQSITPWWYTIEWDIKEAILIEFWSFEEFQKQFSWKALSLFWSWWVYLCKDAENKLVIKRCSFQETPLKNWLVPLLWLDVWEHAYYLHYQNRRADYVEAWRNIVDWNEVNKRYIKLEK